MPWLSRNLYSKLSPDDLEMKLSAQGKRLIVADIDGTLHKGMLFGRYKGITYIDIALYLLPQLVSSPKQLMQFSKALGKIFCSEMIERNEEKHIAGFVEGLNGIDAKLVREACEKTVRNIHPEAVTVLRRLCNNDTSIYLAGKALEPMEKAYEKHLSSLLNRPVYGCSNPPLVKDTKISGLEKIAVTAEQKARHVSDFAFSYHPQHIISFGDSREDVPFMKSYYTSQSLRIAINPKDEEIKAATDVWCWSWEELDNFLAGRKTHLNLKKWFLCGMIGAGALWYASDVPYHNAVMQEGGRMVGDWVTTSGKKDALLSDFHVHINRETTAHELLQKLPEEVDIVTLADKGENELSFSQFKQKLHGEKIPFADKGYLLEIPRQPPLYIGYAQETRVAGYHMLVVGHKSSLHAMSSRSFFDTARAEGGIIILAHPFSAEETNPYISWLLPYTLRTEDMSFVWQIANVDAIEAFNAHNQFWMCASNVKARNAAAGFDIPGTAGSDTHGIIEDVGISGVYFPRNALDFSSDTAFYSSVRKSLQEKNYERKEHYASPINFLTTVAAPWMRWYHYGLLIGVAMGLYFAKKRSHAKI